MRGSRLSVGSLGVAALALCSVPVMAENARDMRFIVGLKSSPATQILKQRGFEFKADKDQANTRHTYWWSKENDNCLHVRSMSGVVVGVDDASDRDCKEGGGGSTAAVVGVAAGAALIAAILAGKKKDKDHNEKYSTQDERDFYDSGFYDGSHGNAFHNPRGSAAYVDGFAEGSRHRETHESKVGFSDLTNARAAGGMTQMENRGFTQVDNFVSGTTRYSIQWRPQSSQCVQITIADGRFKDLRDIGQHPKCAGGGYQSASSGPAMFSDVVGYSGSRARDMLGDRGFKRVDRFGDDNTRYSIMWRAQSRQCLQLMVVDGRAADIRDIQTHPNCR